MSWGLKSLNMRQGQIINNVEVLALFPLWELKHVTNRVINRNILTTISKKSLKDWRFIELRQIPKNLFPFKLGIIMVMAELLDSNLRLLPRSKMPGKNRVVSWWKDSIVNYIPEILQLAEIPPALVKWLNSWVVRLFNHSTNQLLDHLTNCGAKRTKFSCHC